MRETLGRIPKAQVTGKNYINHRFSQMENEEKGRSKMYRTPLISAKPELSNPRTPFKPVVIWIAHIIKRPSVR